MVMDTKNENQALLRQDNESAQDTKETPYNCKRFLLLGSLVLVRFLTSLCSFISAPFFARVMEDKGGTVFEAALSSRIRTLSFVITSAILGRYYSKIGTKILLWSGIFGSVLTQALFGLLEFVNDHTIFVIGAVLTRSFYGVFKAAQFSASNVIAFNEYPDRISLVFGVFQAAAGFGCMFGPGFGGILYDQFGMAIPVLATALLLFISGLFLCCLMQAADYEEDSTADDMISIISFISKPFTIATLLVTGSVFGVLGYADVALTLYFQDAGFSTSYAGVGLMIWGAAFAGVAPIVGYCTGKNIYIRHFSVSIAAILYSGVMFAFTPNQLLSVIYVSCAGLGLFHSISNVPTIEVLLVIANNGPLDRKSNPALYGAVMAIWQSTMGLGLLLPSVIASLIQSETSLSFTPIFYGFSIFNLIVAVVHFILSAVYLPPTDKEK